MLQSMIEEYVGRPTSELIGMTPEEERRYLRESHAASRQKSSKTRVADNGIHARGSMLGAMGRTVTSHGPIRCFLRKSLF